MNALALWWGIALGTLISEDAAGLSAGGMIGQQLLSPWAAASALFLGIWLGDAGLYGVGRLIRHRAQTWSWAQQRCHDHRLATASQWLQRRGAVAIFLSRIIPGTRLPLYLACGFVTYSFWRFLWWTAVAVALWTPLLLGLGALTTTLLDDLLPAPAWLIVVITGVGLWLLIFALRQILHTPSRQRLLLLWHRCRHHEWWPSWALYAPILPALALTAIRLRSLRAPLLVNPALIDSGLIGESKAALLHRLRFAPVLPWCLLPGTNHQQRSALLHAWQRRLSISWPIILKPNAGERGEGVALIEHPAEASQWLEQHPGPAIAQCYDPGPIEIGLFWSRTSASGGIILSITDKSLPFITGDGQRSVGDLIAADPRLRLQAPVFRQYLDHRWHEIPANGSSLALGFAGNHSRGCLFRDGSQWATPALNRVINAWMNTAPGLNHGRFDLRASSVADLVSGAHIKIIEFNGLSSEPTALYDPTRSCWFAWGQLIRCWNQAFAIGARRRRAGYRPPPLSSVWRRLRSAQKPQ